MWISYIPKVILKTLITLGLLHHFFLINKKGKYGNIKFRISQFYDELVIFAKFMSSIHSKNCVSFLTPAISIKMMPVITLNYSTIADWSDQSGSKNVQIFTSILWHACLILQPSYSLKLSIQTHGLLSNPKK